MKLINSLFKKSDLIDIPFFKQLQPGGDGLACIASILASRDPRIELCDIETAYPHFKQGINLRAVIDIFAVHNIKSRALQCPLKELNNLQLPCILHWDMKQFVVLSRFNKGKYEILNPADKKQWLTENELEHHYNEIALEIILIDKP